MPTLAALTHLYFQLEHKVDNDQSADVAEAEDALINEEMMEFIDDVDGTDLSLYDQEQWEKMNKLFAHYGIPDSRDLTIDNNGLLYVTTNIVEIIQNGEWHREGKNESLDLGDMLINENW